MIAIASVGASMCVARCEYATHNRLTSGGLKHRVRRCDTSVASVRQTDRRAIRRSIKKSIFRNYRGGDPEASVDHDWFSHR